MQTVIGIDNFDDKANPIYLALGNFDGVHKGHQSLFKAVIDKAKLNGGKAVAFIFEPQPALILTPDRVPLLLLSSTRKADLLEKLGLNVLIYHSFTREIASCTPEQFVEKILINELQVREVFVGFNYTFGHRGAGTPEQLIEMGKKLGFGVNVIAPVKWGDEPVSSTLVRRALEAGDINTAYNMLGYHPIVEGVVVEGEQRGSEIGFPTANVGVEPIYSIPAKGVYAARAKLGNQVFQCVVNIGSKPTFHQEYPISIEAHLIDFSEDIYGQEIRLSFIEKLRDEQRFDSLEALVAQIALDKDKAREISSTYYGDL